MKQDYKMREKEMQKTYISTIILLLDKCNDISLLDLIQKLLEKSI